MITTIQCPNCLKGNIANIKAPYLSKEATISDKYYTLKCHSCGYEYTNKCEIQNEQQQCNENIIYSLYFNFSFMFI